jgi:hypothetical protein
MTTTIRKLQPTPAFVLAVIALIVAMSGTAVAAVALSANSVKSRHIANGQVAKQDLAADAVRAGKVKDASLSGADVADESLGGADVTDGSLTGGDVQNESLASADVQNESLTGADVAANSLTGADIAEATLGVMSNQVRIVASQGPPQQFGAERVASCAATEKAIGGGAAWLLPGTNSPTQLEAPVTASMPEPAIPAVNGATGWRAAGRNLAGAPRVFRVYAVCVPKQP